MQRSPPDGNKTPQSGSSLIKQLWDNNSSSSSRKRKDRDEDIAEVKQMLKEMRSQQLSKFKNFDDSLNTLKTQNEELKKQNEEMLKNYTMIHKKLEKSLEMYNDLKTSVDNVEGQLSEAMIKVNSLEDEIQHMERNQKLSMIEINNCPLIEEKKLPEVVKNLHTSIGVNSDTLHVRQIYQIKTSKRRTILVEYFNPGEAQAVLKAAKQYNKKNKNEKLNANQLGLQDNKTPVFISESLTSIARKHFFIAREIQKKFSYKFCWTAKGIVYIRKSDEASVIQLKNKEQLENFIRLVENSENIV